MITLRARSASSGEPDAHRQARHLRATALHPSRLRVLWLGACSLWILLLRAVPPGTPVDGTILMDGRDIPYAGRVVWAKAGDVRLGIRGMIGVGFESLDSALPVLLTGDAKGTFTTPRPGRTEASFSS
jgi:hypothetical protein